MLACMSSIDCIVAIAAYMDPVAITSFVIHSNTHKDPTIPIRMRPIALIHDNGQGCI